MALIQSGESNALLTIDEESKAARNTLYDCDGKPVNCRPTGSYIAPIDIRPNTITAGATITLWALSNSNSKFVYIRKIALNGIFTSTNSVSGNWYYYLSRFSGGVPTGGNSVQAIKKRSTYPTSSVQDIRQITVGATTALVVTNLTFESKFHVLTGPRHLAAMYSHALEFDKPNQSYSPFVLGANEGLAILLPVQATNNFDLLTGSVEWDEREE